MVAKRSLKYRFLGLYRLFAGKFQSKKTHMKVSMQFLDIGEASAKAARENNEKAVYKHYYGKSPGKANSAQHSDKQDSTEVSSDK